MTQRLSLHKELSLHKVLLSLNIPLWTRNFYYMGFNGRPQHLNCNTDLPKSTPAEWKLDVSSWKVHYSDCPITSPSSWLWECVPSQPECVSCGFRKAQQITHQTKQHNFLFYSTPSHIFLVFFLSYAHMSSRETGKCSLFMLQDVRRRIRATTMVGIHLSKMVQQLSGTYCSMWIWFNMSYKVSRVSNLIHSVSRLGGSAIFKK